MLLVHFSSYVLPRFSEELLMATEPLNRTVPCELVGDFISSHLGMPRTQYSPTVPVEISINAFWHRRAKGDFVLAV